MKRIFVKHLIILKKTLIFPVFGAVFLLYAACAEPSPLYGIWSDNRGNTFSFFEDGTFSARVIAGGNNIIYEGNYSVLLNALTLSCTNVDLRVITEWDIRGNLLYFDWVNEEGEPHSMTLYKVSN
jgi:hypothetical protein